MSKRKVVETVWFDVILGGKPKVYFMRKDDKGQFSTKTYTPKRNSYRRLTKLAHKLSTSAFGEFYSLITNDPDVIIGWSLTKSYSLYIPPQVAAK